MYHDEIVLVILTMIAPNTAAQKPATTKFFNNAATRPNIAAFRTNRNKPSVMIVSGRVSTNAMGRTIPFTMPSSKAARMNVPVPAILTPGTICDAKNRPTITMSVRITIPCIESLWAEPVGDKSP